MHLELKSYPNTLYIPLLDQALETEGYTVIYCTILYYTVLLLF